MNASISYNFDPLLCWYLELIFVQHMMLLLLVVVVLLIHHSIAVKPASASSTSDSISDSISSGISMESSLFLMKAPEISTVTQTGRTGRTGSDAAAGRHCRAWRKEEHTVHSVDKVVSRRNRKQHHYFVIEKKL